MAGQGCIVAVIGAGVVGLSTAVCIQEKLPAASVTLLADRFGEETTSDGAPAMFVPGSSMPGMSFEMYRNICRDSALWFQHRCMASDSARSGIFLSSGYYFNDQLPEGAPPPNQEFFPCSRPLSRQELLQHHWKPNFKDKGGVVITKTIPQLAELSDSGYDVVVVCAGLRSGALVGDRDVVPMRGHSLRIEAPWLKHFYRREGISSIMPCYDSVFVGVTRELGNSSLIPRPEDRQKLLSEAVKLIPGLQHSNILRDWVGLRPYRESGIRLGKDTIQAGASLMKVVYNYGHGGNGVALSWGTAKMASNLVQESLSTSKSKL